MNMQKYLMPGSASCSKVFKGMKKGLWLIFYVTIWLSALSQNEIEFQNKRLASTMKKNGITDFSQLEEMPSNFKTLNEFQGKFFKVASEGKQSWVKYIYVGRVNSCRAGGCSAVSMVGKGDSEYFDYFIFYDSSITVRLVEVYNYQATHGYEITAKGWLKQFVGFSGKDSLVVNKNIDGITGATISVYAIAADIQFQTEILNSIQ